MKTIIVACGGGIATSATTATKINGRLDDMGLSGKAKAEAVDIKSLDMFMNTADLLHQWQEGSKNTRFRQ